MLGNDAKGTIIFHFNKKEVVRPLYIFLITMNLTYFYLQEQTFIAKNNLHVRK